MEDKHKFFSYNHTTDELIYQDSTIKGEFLARILRETDRGVKHFISIEPNELSEKMDLHSLSRLAEEINKAIASGKRFRIVLEEEEVDGEDVE